MEPVKETGLLKTSDFSISTLCDIDIPALDFGMGRDNVPGRVGLWCGFIATLYYGNHSNNYFFRNADGVMP